MNRKIFKLKALTNLHPGSGDMSFGIVDKLVQRDPVTGFPVIHASGMKGSLRDYCEVNEVITDVEIKRLFGEGSRPGENKFFSAQLLSLPVRSNVRPFFRATCPAIIEHLCESLAMFGFIDPKLKSALGRLKGETFKSGGDFILFPGNHVGIRIEEWQNKNEFSEPEIINTWDDVLKPWLGDKEEFVLLNDAVFIEICENLPVVARNNLQGKGNLWYEELVPRQSEFWFFELYLATDVVKLIIDQMIDGMPFQVGANATVGMGFCKIEEMPEEKNQKTGNEKPVSAIEEAQNSNDNNEKTMNHEAA